MKMVKRGAGVTRVWMCVWERDTNWENMAPGELKRTHRTWGGWHILFLSAAESAHSVGTMVSQFGMESHTHTHIQGLRGFEATCDPSNVFVPNVHSATPRSSVRTCMHIAQIRLSYMVMWRYVRLILVPFLPWQTSLWCALALTWGRKHSSVRPWR